MKNIFKVSLLAATVVLAVGCNKKDEGSDAASAHFKDDSEKTAYAIGSSFSQYIVKTLDKQAEYGMTLDKEAILKGITDTLRDGSKLTDEEVMETLQAYDVKVREAVQNKLLEDKAKQTAYLETNAKAEGVTVTESGLQYSVITKAEGAKPTADDTVTVHYVGTLVDGTEFDSSVARGEPATFTLNQVIPGWIEGVQLMNKGSKYKFVIPAELAYGEQGAGSVPPDSTLIFEVELLDINAK
jgi:FKBP-type peptidyl-prolyl cis-trans isomerase FkpA